MPTTITTNSSGDNDIPSTTSNNTSPNNTSPSKTLKVKDFAGDEEITTHYINTTPPTPPQTLKDHHVSPQQYNTTDAIDDAHTATREVDNNMNSKSNMNNLARPSERLTENHHKIKHSVKLNDTISEGRPSIYLFIFVNPLSGDRKGEELCQLAIQHFRLRRLPQIQVEIHNILDDDDRRIGVNNIQLIEEKLLNGMIPPIPTQTEQAEMKEDAEEQFLIHQQQEKKRSSSINSSVVAAAESTTTSSSKSLSTKAESEKKVFEKGVLSDAVQTRQIHVWSAGGDGTVMSVFELLVASKINLDLVFFSCIPFGTGNDFSQVLGWGRTLTDKNLLGARLQNLEELIADRLEKSEAARLDIWQIDMQSYETGFVRQAGPKERRDGHDVAEVKEPAHNNNEHSLVRKMSNYMSIGVQGYVGSGFEAHRAGNRLANMMVYAHESSKWVFWRRFPDLNHFIKNISQHGENVLECPTPEELKTNKRGSINGLPTMTNRPIDFVIQNIPHIWGREVDLWGEAESGLESVTNRSGPADPKNWKPQRANDGRLEVMTIENMTSYLKKLANIRSHVSRIGQFESPFTINFRPPTDHLKETKKLNTKSTWAKTKAALKDASRHKHEKKNIICIMCDGEFYEIKDPKSISFNRFAQIWTLGRDDDVNQGRLVTDELDALKDDDLPKKDANHDLPVTDDTHPDKIKSDKQRVIDLTKQQHKC